MFFRQRSSNSAFFSSFDLQTSKHCTPTKKSTCWKGSFSIENFLVKEILKISYNLYYKFCHSAFRLYFSVKKFKSCFIFRFCSASCQTMQHYKEINILGTTFSYGIFEYRSFWETHIIFSNYLLYYLGCVF